MIARELLLIAAGRTGLDNDPEVEVAAQRARQAVILSKYQQKEIDPKIRITEADVRAYYESHKDEFTTTDKNGKKTQLSYQEAKERARAMLEAKKRRESIDEIVNRLQQSEGVEIYSDRLSNK
jgi:ABC-type branched-subunit amino acid transport system ATPase component